MKRLWLSLPMAGILMLLAACPDTNKLPNPAPRVPAPKATGSASIQSLIHGPVDPSGIAGREKGTRL